MPDDKNEKEEPFENNTVTDEEVVATPDENRDDESQEENDNARILINTAVSLLKTKHGFLIKEIEAIDKKLCEYNIIEQYLQNQLLIVKKEKNELSPKDDYLKKKRGLEELIEKLSGELTSEDEKIKLAANVIQKIAT